MILPKNRGGGGGRKDPVLGWGASGWMWMKNYSYCINAKESQGEGQVQSEMGSRGGVWVGRGGGLVGSKVGGRGICFHFLL